MAAKTSIEAAIDRNDTLEVLRDVVLQTLYHLISGNENEAYRLRVFQAVAEAQKNCTFVDPAKHTSFDGVGILLAKFAKWEGGLIAKFSADAFEDANFHDTAAELRRDYDAE